LPGQKTLTLPPNLYLGLLPQERFIIRAEEHEMETRGQDEAYEH
jgi:hypothetical protein